MVTDIIDTATAKQLIQAGAVRAASIVGRPGGWSVFLKVGRTEKALAAQRSRQIRVWRSLDRCVAFMRSELGLERFERLDARRYAAEGTIRKIRADAAERLRHAHEAATHDRWFRAEVAKGLRDLAAGRTVSEEEHNARWARRRAALEARIAAAKRKS